MRVERIAKDKVRIFVSYDDLEERGIDKNEIWKNGKKVQELFWDMMETAYVEVGFEVAGPISVEAFTMPTEGVVVIVTRVPSLPQNTRSDDDDDDEDIRLDNLLASFIFKFTDFEEVIRAAYALVDFALDGVLFTYQGSYFLFFDEETLNEEHYDTIWSILQEYGEYNNTTLAMLEEYGKCVIPKQAVDQLTRHFEL